MASNGIGGMTTIIAPMESYAIADDTKDLRAERDKANEDLATLSRAVRNVIHKWREFEDVPLEGRKTLYDAYIKTGGKPF